MTPKDKAEVISLVKNECANFISGNCILLESYPCVVLNSSLSLGDGKIPCKYCRDVVLSLDKDLQAKLVGGVHTKECERCGKQFVPASNRAAFCDKCGALEHKKRQAEYARRKRAKGK
jgi:hypothetical protein